MFALEKIPSAIRKCCACCEPKYASSVAVSIISIGFWTYLLTISVVQYNNLRQCDDNFESLVFVIPFVQLVSVVNATLSCLMVYVTMKESREFVFPWLVAVALEVCILLFSGILNYYNFNALVLRGYFRYFLLVDYLLYLCAVVLVYYRLISKNRECNDDVNLL